MNKSNSQYNDYSPDLSSLDENPITIIDQPLETGPIRNPRAGGKKGKSKNKKKEDKPKKATAAPGIFKSIHDFFTGTSFRLIMGIFMGCIGLYLLVSFISYFANCIEDQSLINSMPVGQALTVSNAGGEGGARLAEFLINECFGLGSLVIVVWILAMSLKLLIGRPRFKSIDFTIKCIIVLLTVSLLIGLITISSHTPVNWGGYHGRYVNEFIVGFIGWSGAVLLSLFMISLFVVICLRDVVKWIMAKYHQHKEKKRIQAEIRAEKEAREREILRMQQQEKIDDLKAGETTFIAEQSEETDNTNVAFGSGDLPLYEVPSEHPDLSSYMPSQSSESDITDDNGQTESEKEQDETSDKTLENHEVEKQDTPKEEPMVVNVNNIGEAEKTHFKSEVDVLESTNYKFPPVELLRPGKEQISVDMDEQASNKERIEKTLLDFGIPIKKITATVGPTVTLYEIVPDSGVKIARIRSLVDDIALSLSASGVRIIAPIPGKGTVGIEVANKDPQTVSMRTIIKSKAFQETKYNLPIALGSTISNDVYVADLTKMPHLLVAGATGQGKSVGLNVIIASLLYSKAPWQLKFVMIDPKQVEFSLYNKIKDHYMAMIPGDNAEEPVITEMQRVENTLNSLCEEMDQRYTLLKTAHARNVEEYNTKIKNGLLNPNEGHRFLPYIVIIVDEFGDLVMVAGKNVEMPIARLAQKARAVGMHVIIATQRPSTNVITGIIKANFPTRISFKVTSGVDSKTILDTPGAQQLIGRGDMLIFNNSEMVRVQCAFIDTPEVEEICDYVYRQPYPTGIYMLPEPPVAAGEDGAGGKDISYSDRDMMFEEVARAIVGGQTASTSSIQRHFRIGYTRAGRIMDQLEKAGVVGPNQGGKPRGVLMSPSELEDFLATF